jgi:flagellar biosynthesis component FlhA
MATLMGRATAGTDQATREAVSQCVSSLPDPSASWRVLDRLDDAVDAAPTQAAANLRVLETAVQEYLNSWFGLGSEAAEPLTPFVTPLVLEIGEDLTPSIDDAQDGGRFLYQLVPAMRARTLAETGVTLPGVRARGGFLPPNGFRILFDEVEVARGAVPPGASGCVVPFDHRRHSGDQLLGRHPVTGAIGPWALTVDPGECVEGSRMGPEMVIRVKLEQQAREHLELFCGIDEVDAMVDSWMADESVARSAEELLPDEEARLRLTWLVQRLARDGVPLLAPVVLEGLTTAGGVQGDIDVLESSVRARAGELLPGREPGRVRWSLPEDQGGPAVPPHRPGLADRLARIRFVAWLRERLAEDGPWATLVTPDAATRRSVAEVVRTVEPNLAVLCSDEVAEP